MDSKGFTWLKTYLARSTKSSFVHTNSVCSCCGSFIQGAGNPAFEYVKGITFGKPEATLPTRQNFPGHEAGVAQPDVVLKYVDLSKESGVQLQYVIAIQENFSEYFNDNRERPYERKP